MDLCQVNPEFNLYDPEWPMRTYQVQAPPRSSSSPTRAPLRPGARLDHLGRLHHLGQPHRRQRAVPQRPRAQLLRHRAEHPDAGRPRRPARADPPRHHRPRRVHPARRAHRLQRRRGSPAPHRHRAGIVVVTTDDEPFIGEISEDGAEATKQEFDRRGARSLIADEAPSGRSLQSRAHEDSEQS